MQPSLWIMSPRVSEARLRSAACRVGGHPLVSFRGRCPWSSGTRIQDTSWDVCDAGCCFHVQPCTAAWRSCRWRSFSLSPFTYWEPHLRARPQESFCPIKNVTLTEWKMHLGVLLRTSVMLSDTFRTNILCAFLGSEKVSWKQCVSCVIFLAVSYIVWKQLENFKLSDNLWTVKGR